MLNPMGDTQKPVLRALPAGGQCCWVICASAPIGLWMFSMRAAPTRLKFLALAECPGSSEVAYSGKRKPLGKEAQVLAGSQEAGSGG